MDIVVDTMTADSGLTNQYKTEELKTKLLQCLKESNQQITHAVQSFLDKPNRTSDDALLLLKAVIDASDYILKADNWDSSLFLRNTVKSVAAIKAEAEAEFNHYQQAQEVSTQSMSADQDETEVYILLFQSESGSLEKWEMQLRSLELYMVSRPVYQHESDIEKRIRLRNAVMNEAYVIVAVKNFDIQSDVAQTTLKDQYGHPLLQLKETALQRGKILGFVRQGIRYRFINGKLVK